MGFLDKVKEQAATATAAAKDAAQKGQAKLDEVQAKRGADAILRDLGAAYYAQQTGRGTAQTGADIERLVGQLREHEQAHGALELQPSAPAAAAPGAVGGTVPVAPPVAPAAGGTPPPPPSGISV
jgi:pyruvate/2-oxoglutarate dehydrogenase complex dihydrolipoamide acyltransferase (E2) component